MNMNFEMPLSLLQISLPSMCVGFLFAGFLLYSYMVLTFKDEKYKTILLSDILALIFVGSEVFVIIIGGLQLNFQTSVYFHITEQLSGVVFIFALPYLIRTFLKIGPIWEKINKYILYISGLIVILIILAAIISPDLFISIKVQKHTANIFQSDYGRGEEGILYSIRDLLLALIISYSFFSIWMDYKKNKELERIIFLAIGLFFAIYGAAVDIIYVYTSVNYDFLTHFEFSRFSLGLTILILCMMAGSMRKFIRDSKDLEKAHSKLAASEKKYRCIIEGTDDCILTFDKNLNLLSANKASIKKLRIDKENINIHFFDLLTQNREKNDLSLQLVQDKINTLFEKGTPVIFRSFFSASYSGEPKEYNARMEYIKNEISEEIILRLSRTESESISSFIVSENLKLSMNNYILSVEDVCSRLTAHLPSFTDETSMNQIRIGLREIIVNAIEHGNLNISYSEKSVKSMECTYLQYVIDRQNDELYKDRRVHINYELTEDKVIYHIQDDGDGFDIHSTLKNIKENPESLELAHGRGIIMILNIFDEVDYNEKGNSVKLIKYFKN